MTATKLKKTRIRPSKYSRSVRITVGQVRADPETAREPDPPPQGNATG